jgi:hypothetical protein
MSTSSSAKTVIRIIGGATVAALVLSGGYAVATEVASTERTDRMSLDIGGITSLAARTDVGSVRVEQGPTSSGKVEVQVHRRGSWRLPTVDNHRQGDSLVLSGDCPSGFTNRCSTDWVIRVPVVLDVNATTAVGDVFARGEFRSASLETATGDVTTTSFRSGTTRVVSNVGDVSLNFVTAPQHVDVASSVGDVQVLVPDDGTAYDVRATTSLGKHQTTVPVDSTSPRSIRVTSSVGDSRVLASTP